MDIITAKWTSHSRILLFYHKHKDVSCNGKEQKCVFRTHPASHHDEKQTEGGGKKKPQLLWKFHLYSSGRGGLDTVLADKKKYETKTVTTLASSDAVRPLLCKCIISKT